MKTIILILAIFFAAGTVAVQFGCKTKGKAVKASTVNETPGARNDKPDGDAKKNEPPQSGPELPPAEIAVDQTASSDSSVLEPAVESLRQSIEGRQIPRAVVVRLGEGGKSSWAGNKHEFILPLVPTGVFDEAAMETSMKETDRKCWARLQCRKDRLKKMREEFDGSQADKVREAREKRGVQSKQIFDSILAPTKGAAVCSDLVSFRDRLIADGYKLLVFFSDGKHDCETPIVTKRFAPDVKVFVLQMPLKGESSGNDFGERTKTLERIFVGDGVTIMPAVSADKGAFDKFFQ